ncbi:MAG: BrnT family toxin [Lachnospiraceae bacterium]|nr:BrnT family toxin [Lachnospiraceae bacterium]
MLRFEWDDEKNRANIIKHEVDFDELSTVFWDENAILFDDPDHSISARKATRKESERYARGI